MDDYSTVDTSFNLVFDCFRPVRKTRLCKDIRDFVSSCFMIFVNGRVSYTPSKWPYFSGSLYYMSLVFLCLWHENQSSSKNSPREKGWRQCPVRIQPVTPLLWCPRPEIEIPVRLLGNGFSLMFYSPQCRGRMRNEFFRRRGTLQQNMWC